MVIGFKIVEKTVENGDIIGDSWELSTPYDEIDICNINWSKNGIIQTIEVPGIVHATLLLNDIIAKISYISSNLYKNKNKQISYVILFMHENPLYGPTFGNTNSINYIDNIEERHLYAIINDIYTEKGLGTLSENQYKKSVPKYKKASKKTKFDYWCSSLNIKYAAIYIISNSNPKPSLVMYIKYKDNNRCVSYEFDKVSSATFSSITDLPKKYIEEDVWES